MNSSTSSDADPEVTPRASSPSKRRRLAFDAALNLQHPSEYQNDALTMPTRSTKMSITGTSRSTRLQSPVKNIADLTLAEKPVRFTYLKSRGDLPADITSLLNNIKTVGCRHGIMPKPIVETVQASLGLIDPNITDDNIYEKNL